VVGGTVVGGIVVGGTVVGGIVVGGIVVGGIVVGGIVVGGIVVGGIVVVVLGGQVVVVLGGRVVVVFGGQVVVVFLVPARTSCGNNAAKEPPPSIPRTFRTAPRRDSGVARALVNASKFSGFISVCTFQLGTMSIFTCRDWHAKHEKKIIAGKEKSSDQVSILQVS